MYDSFSQANSFHSSPRDSENICPLVDEVHCVWLLHLLAYTRKNEYYSFIIEAGI